jgi:uncharacterized protein (DUF433 family)
MTHSAAAEPLAASVGEDGARNHNAIPGSSYLGVGLYSLPEAARLLHMPAATLRRWVGEDRHSDNARKAGAAPLIRRDDPELVAQGILTFAELIEILLIRRFREAGVRLARIRALVQEETATLQTTHPFATRRFYTDRQRLPEALRPVLEAFVQHIDYEGDQVSRYWPLSKERRVVLDPARAFGQPTDPVSAVPTAVLAGAYAAGEPIEEVAQWYRVDPEAVRDAIAFEESLAAMRLPRAA